MSSTRFERFSDVAAKAGASRGDAEELAAYLQRQHNRASRLDAERVGKELHLARDEAIELFEIAAGAEAGLLEEAPRLECPRCGSWIDREHLEAEIHGGGVAECPDCQLEIEDLSQLPSQLRYRLTDEASAEAIAHQGSRANLR